MSFYNETDYLHGKRKQRWERLERIKYYKGSGTSISNEAKEYFKKMHVVDYLLNETSDESIDLEAFNKGRADDRKDLNGNFSNEQVLDTKETQVGFDKFIHGELIQFSHTDLKGQSPMVDGLKESQRKVLFGGFKRNLTNEIGTAQFGGYVSEHARLSSRRSKFIFHYH